MTPGRLVSGLIAHLGVTTALVDVGAASQPASHLQPAAGVARLTAGGGGKVPAAGKNLPAALGVLLPPTAGEPRRGAGAAATQPATPSHPHLATYVSRIGILYKY